ncbi:hypothetical protein [Psychrobacter immobilis]|uniref:hypothetical protein n=1 Tax=Psychrobacter immobilis TaxID=498 RepID=UPI001917FA91|nr:hypothetical protein [Psychrobacter immobilis]
MKSYILRRFDSKLEEMNDQLCYFLFSDVEVNNVFSKLTLDVSDSFTTEVFLENEFSKRLHIKVDALAELRNKSFHTLVSMSVIASVEYLLSFVEEVEKFRSQIVPSVYDEIKDKEPEEQLKLKLTGWLGNEPENGIIKTIKYLRLRRNHIAHAREELSEGYRSLIKNDSNYLNTYWSKKTTELKDFDFAKRSYAEFETNEVFALINLSRICMREIDSIMLSSIYEEDIANYELHIFLENKKLNGLELDVKSRKFSAFLRHQYGKKISCAESIITAHFEND